MDTNGKTHICDWAELPQIIFRGKDETVAMLQARYEGLSSIHEDMLRHLPIVEDEMGKVQRAIAAINGDDFVEPFEHEQSVRRGSNVRCGAAVVDDIKACKTQRSALYVIGQKNDGLIDLNSAVDLIVAAQLNRGTRKSALSTLHHFMSASDDFQWVAPSTFTLKCEEPELTTGDVLALAEQDGRNERQASLSA